MDKKLKKYAEKQLAPYQNEKFLMELKSKINEQKKEKANKRKKFVSMWLSFGGTIAVIVVVLICVFVIKPANNIQENSQTPIQIEPNSEEILQKKYLEENRKTLEVTLEELNSILQDISFCGENCSVKKIIDNYYNEQLYYYVTYNDNEGFIQADFTISVNPNYIIDSAYKEYDRQGIVASFEIQYAEDSEIEEGMFFFTDSGVIKTEHEVIYTNAEIIGFDDNNNFIEMLNEIIEAK